MKTRNLFIMAAFLLLTSCDKLYYADRPPKKWNNQYVDPYYIFEHRHTLAWGDTVMIWGWLDQEAGFDDDFINIKDDSSFVWDGRQKSLSHFAQILRYVGDGVLIEIPDDRPCKVYATAIFHHNAGDCQCDWSYGFRPLREEDIIFEPINSNNDEK